MRRGDEKKESILKVCFRTSWKGKKGGHDERGPQPLGKERLKGREGGGLLALGVFMQFISKKTWGGESKTETVEDQGGLGEVCITGG